MLAESAIARSICLLRHHRFRGRSMHAPLTLFRQPFSARQKEGGPIRQPIMAMTENRLLIDMLLAEQQTLTAVEQFSRRHDRHAFVPGTNQYRDLIPLTA